MKKRCTKWRDNKGVALVIVAGLTVMFVALIALSVDIAHLYAVKNELQNAADAGALAGARRLYFPEGTAVNPAANQVADRAARANNSERVEVEVNDPDSNTGDVQRGHWSFVTRTFTPWDELDPPDLWNSTSAELDADPAFVNAVMVRTHRVRTQASSFFARIIRYTGFNVSAEAVAYLGFTGTLAPDELDLPVALCSRSLMEIVDGEEVYSCSGGRMLNSGSNLCTFNTGGWTDYTQPTPCNGSADVQFLKDILPSPGVCTETGNPESITFGELTNIQTGVVESVFRGLKECWLNKTSGATEPWSVTLPVIDCTKPNAEGCSNLAGAVNVNILWINDNTDKIQDFPASASGWTAEPSEITGIQRWNSFVTHFNIQNPCGSLALYNSDPQLSGYQNKNIYFAPDCTPHYPEGNTGGHNFGILAKRPVLVD